MLTKPAPTGKTLTNKQKKLTLCRKKGNLPDGAQTTKQKNKPDVLLYRYDEQLQIPFFETIDSTDYWS